MIDFDIREYVRLMSSISLSQSEKDRITQYLIEERLTKKEISKKYVAAASVVAALAVGAVLAVRNSRQDINIM